MDQPEVRGSTRLEATVPLGDGEALDRLRQRTDDAVTRPAGSTALLDANLPSEPPPETSREPETGREPEAGREPDNDASGA
jgi:hypothetical protein